MSKNLFFSIKNLSDDEGEIRISGEITRWAWEEFGETSSLIFIKQLEKIKNARKVSIKINSPGGDISETLAIYHELKRLSQTKEITAYIDGMACSAATLIAIAAKKTIMGKGCYFMIHNPMIYMGYSNTGEMQEAIEHLNKTKENMIDLYEEKSSLSREDIAKKMDEETYFSAQEALEAGFIDEIASYDTNTVTSNIVNVCSMNLKNSKKIPKELSEILNKKENKEEKMTLIELRAQYPELLNQFEGEILNSVTSTDTVKNTINKAVQTAITEERKRIQSLDGIKTYSQAAKDIINKAKFEEPRDYKDIIVDLYNMNSEQAGKEIEMIEGEKAAAGFNNISSAIEGSAKEQMISNIVEAALKELKINK
ncbi:ATP-dependent Clp protease protease subunit [Fusobacterium sp. PH5-7]|uniref:head maturation protease, ClpP-related n=1 Tax=Fusobacterium sp. PH5-7 TaxID=2940528 RepID=UPI0024757269|nr:head maturation protease, ClpP-related [Fusobacterium sp. PH5-7]MDH6456920.1 ATP-dependent Clp protease protease subunit [Fusobacterium sp. PH5-7]